MKIKHLSKILARAHCSLNGSQRAETGTWDLECILRAQLMENMLLVYAHNTFPSGIEKQNLAFCWGDADTHSRITTQSRSQLTTTEGV